MTVASTPRREFRGTAIATIAISVIIVIIWLGFWLLQAYVETEGLDRFGLYGPLLGSLVLTALLSIAALVLAIITLIRSRSRLLKAVATVVAAIAVVGTGVIALSLFGLV